jgi:hypothetical protein
MRADFGLFSFALCVLILALKRVLLLVMAASP